METLIIRPENAKQAKTLKDLLKAFDVKVDSVPGFKEEPLPDDIIRLMKKGINDADNNRLTPNSEFLGSIKSKYLK